MDQAVVKDVQIQLTMGDIAKQADVKAVVNAANAQLKTGGGVAGALHRAAGPELEEACRPLAPIRPGEAVITEAFRLPNEYVIHCLGPVYGEDEPADRLLGDCYRNALKLANDNGIDSIAFPAISTGAFGYPVKEAARVAIEAVRFATADLEGVRLVRFVLHQQDALNVHEKVMEEIFGKPNG